MTHVLLPLGVAVASGLILLGVRWLLRLIYELGELRGRVTTINNALMSDRRAAIKGLASGEYPKPPWLQGFRDEYTTWIRLKGKGRGSEQ